MAKKLKEIGRFGKSTYTLLSLQNLYTGEQETSQW